MTGAKTQSRGVITKAGHMKIDDLIKAALFGLTICAMPLAMAAPSAVAAETLRVVKRGTSRSLDVPMNRAVVVESDIPFAELSIANPGIADIFVTFGSHDLCIG